MGRREYLRRIPVRLCQWREPAAACFFYAGLVIIGSGFRSGGWPRRPRSNQVTRFGGFFDSVVDRYSDASSLFRTARLYARGNRFFYVVLTALVMISAIMGAMRAPVPSRSLHVPRGDSWNARNASCY